MSSSVTLDVEVSMVNTDLARLLAVATELVSHFFLFIVWVEVIEVVDKKLWASIDPSFASPKVIADALYTFPATNVLLSLSNNPRVRLHIPWVVATFIMLSESV
jgi:hypothetical protein